MAEPISKVTCGAGENAEAEVTLSGHHWDRGALMCESGPAMHVRLVSPKCATIRMGQHVHLDISELGIDEEFVAISPGKPPHEFLFASVRKCHDNDGPTADEIAAATTDYVDDVTKTLVVHTLENLTQAHPEIFAPNVGVPDPAKLSFSIGGAIIGPKVDILGCNATSEVVLPKHIVDQLVAAAKRGAKDT